MLALLFLCACCTLLTAQLIPVESEEEAYDIPLTTLKFDETEASFGTILSGETVEHVYIFTNTGDEPLILSSAKGSCGCTVPSWPRAPIAPGETASITVQFDSKNKVGTRVQKITVTANTDPARHTLFFRGEVMVDESQMEDLEETLPDPGDLNAFMEAGGKDCLSIFPNPTSEILNIDVTAYEGKTAEVRIFSRQGQLMARRQVDRLETRLQFEVAHYPAGTYVANIQIGGETAVVRCFAVQR